MLILDPTTAKVLVCILCQSAGRNPIDGEPLLGAAQVEAQAAGWKAGLALAQRIAQVAPLQACDLDPQKSEVPSEVRDTHKVEVLLLGTPATLGAHLAKAKQ